MNEYKLFDEYLKKSKSIKDFCEQNEKLLFESIRMNIEYDGNDYLLNSVGVEIDKVISYIEKLKNESEIPQSFRELC